RPGFKEPEGDERLSFFKDWSRRLYDAGFIGLTWPEEYGGHDAPLTHHVIFLEEMGRSGAPEHVGPIGLGMAGPTILAHGTEEQKRRYLPPLLTGDEVWCQGFSEPGAGSDLAALSTRAELRGDEYVITGQKVWSSFAHFVDFCILLARSDPTGTKHQGLTYFVLPMRAEGVEVRPLRQITGEAEFNEIFLDAVRVPAENVVGAPGQGWNVAITTLMHERANLAVMLTVRLEVVLSQLMDLARTTRRDGRRAADDPLVRDRIAELWTELQALRLTNYRALSTMLATGFPGPEGSTVKIVWAETNQRLTKLALEIEGPYAMLSGGEHAVQDGLWQRLQLRSRGNSIEGGTSEILRGIIAERILSLPKSR
ncbi:MAG: acyl-CoA dehydrogenase family protein, partial [Actinobacteria bacterium]|nr:acyl-CoA dehydrogenase family protein [Actinomycetota bacterium]